MELCSYAATDALGSMLLASSTIHTLVAAVDDCRSSKQATKKRKMKSEKERNHWTRRVPVPENATRLGKASEAPNPLRRIAASHLHLPSPASVAGVASVRVVSTASGGALAHLLVTVGGQARKQITQSARPPRSERMSELSRAKWSASSTPRRALSHRFICKHRFDQRTTVKCSLPTEA